MPPPGPLKHQSMKTLLLLALTALISLVDLRAEVQLQGSPEELAAALANAPRLATVTGSAEVRTNANRARIDLLVTTENRSLDLALAENARVREQLIRSLTGTGIGPHQIENSDFASDQRRALFSDKVKSYRIENHVIVSVSDGKQFRALAQRLDALPEAVVQNIEFDHTENKALQRLAVERALADAGAQKAVYEQALGVKLTVRTFTEGAFVSLPEPGVQGGSAPGSSFEFGKRSPKHLAPMSASSEPSFVFGQLIFRAAVTVQYAVEPAR